ncbi:MAG: alpha/beta fold hydrolase, partial [Phenylobacterium sp.]
MLLESGFGAGAFAWGQAQPIVARTTRVCSYDRAGYGFSDPGPSPRDGAAIARDLDAALRRAGERGPFVIVGHSAGGLYARLFAARRHS